MLQAVATPRRREILRLVWAGERPAGEIHLALGDVTFGAVSQHLRVLAAAGAISGRREGRRRLYVARQEALGSLAPWLETMWDDALYRLKLQAELDEARRGPRSRGTPRRRGEKGRLTRSGRSPAPARPRVRSAKAASRSSGPTSGRGPSRGKGKERS